MNRHTDEELVSLCLAGRKDAFDEIVQRYQKPVFKIAYTLAGNYEDASDWSQDSFLQIYRSLKSFDAEKGKFFSWLYRVAHNVCINKKAQRDGARPKKATADEFEQEQESKARIVSIESIAEPTVPESDVKSNPQAALEAAGLQEEIRTALARLGEKYSVPIMLQYIEGLSYKEISERLGLPQSTIETRLFRGKKMLQKELQHRKK